MLLLRAALHANAGRLQRRRQGRRRRGRLADVWGHRLPGQRRRHLAGAPSSSTPTSGTGPNSVTAADFNADGKLDLVTTNYFSNSRECPAGQRRRHASQPPQSFGAGERTPDRPPPATSTATASSISSSPISHPRRPGVSVLLGKGDGQLTAPITTRHRRLSKLPGHGGLQRRWPPGRGGGEHRLEQRRDPAQRRQLDRPTRRGSPSAM